MHRWRHRRRRRTAAFRRRWEQWGIGGPWIWALLGIAAALLLIRQIDNSLKPLVTELASAEVQNAVTEVITEEVTKALEAGAWTYDSMVTIQRDEAGRIIALQSNVAEVNAFRAQVITAVLDQVTALDVKEFEIHLGNLFDWDLLSGRGPAIQVRALTVSGVNAQFDSVFTSAGINQTRHQIFLNVHVPTTILIASRTTKMDVETSLCVAETVIVGEVPDTYLELPQTS